MKRKKEESAPSGDELVPEKKKKEEFTEIEFRVLIKDPNSRFQVLEKFLKNAQEFPKEHNYDIVAAYCKSSGECTEIFQLMEEGKRKAPELCIIFNVLEHILTRVATDLTRYKVVAENIIKKVLASFMHNVYNLMSKSNKSNQMKASLKLLSAMVIQGERAARDVFLQMNFNHSNIRPLLSRKDTKDPDDVRTCLIYFYMSFLLHGDNSLVRSFVSTKGILQSIFSGMTYDKPAVVELILETLQSKVIENPAINKTVKIRLFDESSLKSLIQLYYWKGPYKFKFGKKKKEEADAMDTQEELTGTDSDDLALVRENIHKMLLELCCSNKNGINFYDKTLGTSGKNQNHVLTAFLTSLKKPYDNPQIKELVVKTLKTCPDQLNKYFTSLQDRFLPRVSPSWVACMTFLTEIYESQSDVPSSLKTGDIPLPKLVKMAQVTIIPTAVILNFISQAVKKRSIPLVRHMALKFVSVVLGKVQRVVEYFESKECSYTSEVKSEFVQLFLEVIQKNLPDFKSISSCWDFLLRDQTEDSATPAGEMEVEEAEEMHKSAPIDVEMVELKTTVIQTLASYRKTFPHSTHEHFINLSSFLDGVKKASNDEKDQAKLSKLYLSVLSLLANSDTRLIPWNKVNDQGESFVYLVLEMLFTTAYDQDLAMATKDQVVKLLVGTGLFDHIEDELVIWLNHLITSEENVRPAILKYLEKVFTTLLTTPQAYTDQVAKVVQEAQQVESVLDVAAGGGDAAQALIQALIQSIISRDEIPLDKYDPMDEDVDDAWDDSTVFATRIPFSPLVPVCLRVLEKFEESKTEVSAYLHKVLMEILHGQVDPKPFHLMVEQRGSHFDDQSFKDYVNSFIVAPGIELQPSKSSEKVRKKLLKEKDPCAILKTCWRKRPDLFQDDDINSHVVEVTGRLNQHKQVAVVKQILLYVHTAVTTPKTESEHAKQLTDGLLWLLIDIIDSARITSEEESTSTKEETTPTDEENMEKTDQVDISHQMIQLVLKHPTVVDNFFVPAENCSVLLDLSHCITNNLGSILLYALDAEKGNPLCVPFLDKLMHTLFHDASGLYQSAAFGMVSMLAEYMSPERLVTIGNRLLELPSKDLVSENGLQVAGVTVVKVLDEIAKGQEILRNGNCPKDVDGLTFTGIQRVCQMLLQLPSQSLSEIHNLHQLLDVFKKLLYTFPHYAAVFDYENFVQLLDLGYTSNPEVSAAVLLVVELVLKYNAGGKTYFQTWIDNNDKRLKKHRLLYVPLFTTYLGLVQSDVVTPYVKTADDLYWEFGIKSLLEESDPAQDEFMLYLLVLLLQRKSDEEMLAVTQKLCSELQSKKAIPVRLIRLLEAMLDQLFKSDDMKGDQSEEAVNTIHTCLSLLGGVFAVKSDDSKEKAVVISFIKNVTRYLKMMDKESPLLKKLSSALRPNWPKVVKLGLRNHFETAEVHQLLAFLADYMYDGEDDEGLEPAPKMFLEMIMSHSKFLPVMLGEVKNLPTKGAIVDLLHAVVSKNPACCQQSHASIYLAAYGATLSDTDRKLLQLLLMYESSGIDMSPYRPYMWGPKSVEHLAVKKDLGPSLWKHATTEQVLEMLDEKKLMSSALKFPLRRKLLPSPDHSEELEPISDCYDPCFLLPLFSYLLRPAALVNCHAFIERNCFGYALAALSSHDAHMRGAAYHVLARFYQQLEGSKFLGKEHVMYLLDCIRNSMESPNTKLACIIGVFLVKAAQLLINPVDHMYSMIQSFLLLKPALDLVNIPEFYKLFNSSAIEFKIERRWVLSLMADGLRESADYKIFEKKFAFKLLLSFHDSPTSDVATQGLVLKIVHEGCKIKKVSYELIKNQGILAWLNGVISHRLGEGNKMELVIGILASLWSTIAGDRDDNKKENKCLPLVFLSEILFTLLNLLHNLGEASDIHVHKDLHQKYVLTLSSVVKELLVTEATHVASGYQTFKLKPSLMHLLKIVQLSAMCSGDSEVLSSLKALESKTVKHANKNTNIENVPKLPRSGKIDSSELTEHFVRIVTSCPMDLTGMGSDVSPVELDRIVQTVILIQDWLLKSLLNVPVKSWTGLLHMTLQWFVDVLEKDCLVVNQLKERLIQSSEAGTNRVTDYLLPLFSQISAVQVGDLDILRLSSFHFERVHHVRECDEVTKLRLLLCKVFLLLTDWALKADSESTRVDDVKKRARMFTASLTDADILEDREGAAEKVSVLLTELWMGASKPRFAEPKSILTKSSIKTPTSVKRTASEMSPAVTRCAKTLKTPKSAKKDVTPRMDESIQTLTPKMISGRKEKFGTPKTPKSCKMTATPSVVELGVTPSQPENLGNSKTPKSGKMTATPSVAKLGVTPSQLENLGNPKTPKSGKKAATPSVAKLGVTPSQLENLGNPKTPKSGKKAATPSVAKLGVTPSQLENLENPKTPKSGKKDATPSVAKLPVTPSMKPDQQKKPKTPTSVKRA